MARILLLCGLLLAACSQAQPTGGNRAGPAEQQPGGAASDCPAGRDCSDLLPPARMRGVWVTGFERSGFVPDATEAPLYGDPSPERIWLSFANAPPDPALRAELDKMRTTAAVAIEFVGRRSRDPGNYGHLGGARDMVVVERIVSARILGPLRR